MHTTLKDFLAAQHEDQIDKLAQRALVVLGKCSGQRGLLDNANKRGDAEAWTAMSRAHYEASAAFVLAHQVKAYAFGGELIANFAVQEVGTEEPAAAAAYLLELAESAIEAYAHRCKPVCAIVGDVGVHILRGQHAAEAMNDVRAANAA